MILSLIAASALVAQSAPPAVNKFRIDERMVRPPGARLVWRDEFSGSRLDRSKWDYDTAYNKRGWFNGELQYYSAGRPENIRVAGGRLVIAARRERLDPKLYPDWGGQNYTSAKIVTRGKAQWTYGYYEIRAKLPCARGTWPAIWMLPTKMVRWPEEGEIDIMEQVGSEPNLIYASLHTQLFNHVQKTQRSVQKLLPTSCATFHTYQLDWRPNAITIGFDGRAYLRVRNNQTGGKGAWPFNTPFYMILNLAMGGDWAAAKGMDDAALPQRMEVDYVRVWKRR
jgi:beta-glucanase (GH16 family)